MNKQRKQRIFKADAMGDIMYIGAKDQAEAARKLQDVCGPIPKSMIDWSEVDSLPKGEVLMAEPA